MCQTRHSLEPVWRAFLELAGEIEPVNAPEFPPDKPLETEIGPLKPPLAPLQGEYPDVHRSKQEITALQSVSYADSDYSYPDVLPEERQQLELAISSLMQTRRKQQAWAASGCSYLRW